MDRPDWRCKTVVSMGSVDIMTQGVNGYGTVAAVEALMPQGVQPHSLHGNLTANALHNYVHKKSKS